MNKDEVVLNTRYSELIKGKKFNKASRDIVFEACRAPIIEIPLNTIASGNYDEKQMKELLRLYKSKVGAFSVYKKQYEQMIKYRYSGEQMHCIITAMEKGFDSCNIEFMMDLDKDRDFNAGQMHEIYECFLKGIAYEVVEGFAKHNVSAYRISCTKDVLVSKLDIDIFQYWKMNDDLFGTICKSLLLGATTEDIDNTLIITTDFQIADVILSGSVDGLDIEQINSLINKEYSIAKITSLIETYKEFYTDGFCFRLKEIENEKYDCLMEFYKGHEGFVNYILELNEKFVSTQTIVHRANGETEFNDGVENAIDIYLSIYKQSMNKVDSPKIEEKSLLLYGEEYINKIIEKWLSDQEKFAILNFDVVANRVLYNEYAKVNVVDYKKLLYDAMLLHNPLLECYKQMSDMLYEYTQVEKIQSELKLSSRNQNDLVFSNKDNDVLIYVKTVEKNYQLQKIEITIGTEQRTFDAKEAESFVFRRNELSRKVDIKEKDKTEVKEKEAVFVR